jgi:hypothetical protein
MFLLAKGVIPSPCRVTPGYLKRLLPRYPYRHPNFIRMVNALYWRSRLLFNQANGDDNEEVCYVVQSMSEV